MTKWSVWQRLFILAVTGVAMLSACGGKGNSNAPAVAVLSTDPNLLMQTELEKAGLDFNNVVAVRLLHDGKRLEFSTVTPIVVAETMVSGQPSKTIFRMNRTADGIIMFSRDIIQGSAIKIEMKLLDLEAKKGFRFPVVQAGGSLKEETFTLEKIVRLEK